LNLGLDIVNLGLHVVNGVGLPCVKRNIFAVKGALIRALVSSPEPEGESRSCAQAQLSRLGVGVVLRVLDGCTRAHPRDVAPEPVSELKTCSRAFMLDCSRCSLGIFCRVVMVIEVVTADEGPD
jgi:hypothetical protein